MVDDVIRVSLDSAEAIRNYQRLAQAANESLRRQQEGARETAKQIALMNIALGAASKAWDLLTGQVSKAIELGRENERTTIRLRNALASAGYEISTNAAALDAQSRALEKATNISDENIRSMQSFALTLGVDIDKVDGFVRAAIRMSNVTGQQVNEAMKQLVKTTSGLAGELGEANPAVRALSQEELRAGKAIDIINESMEYQLGLLTEGTVGAELGLYGAWNNLLEAMVKVGNETGVVKDVFDRLAGSVQKLADLIPAVAGLLSNDEQIGRVADQTQAFIADFGVSPGEYRERFGTLDISDQNLLAKAYPALFQTFDEISRDVGKQMAEEEARKRGEKRREAAKRPDIVGGGDVESVLGGAILEAQQEQADRRVEIAEALTEELLKEEEMRADAILSLEQRIADGKEEIRDSNFDRLVKATNDEIALEQQAARERAAIAERSFRFVASAGQAMTDALIGGLFAVAEGADVAWEKIVLGAFKGIGMQMLAAGIADITEGTARLIRSYGADQSGTALIAQGGVETAIGGGLIAGTLIATAATSGGGGGASGPGLGGGAGGAGGATRALPGQGNTAASAPDTIVVNLWGDPSERDIARVTDKFRSAKRKGFRAL